MPIDLETDHDVDGPPPPPAGGWRLSSVPLDYDEDQKLMDSPDQPPEDEGPVGRKPETLSELFSDQSQPPPTPPDEPSVKLADSKPVTPPVIQPHDPCHELMEEWVRWRDIHEWDLNNADEYSGPAWEFSDPIDIAAHYDPTELQRLKEIAKESQKKMDDAWNAYQECARKRLNLPTYDPEHAFNTDTVQDTDWGY